MPTRLKIVFFGIGPLIALDLITRRYRVKYAELARVAIDLDKQNTALHEQMNYLVSVINANDIELDEFDLIVLTSVVKV